MPRLFAMVLVFLGLIPQAALASSECFPGTDELLHVTSWSISKAMRGAIVSVSLTYSGGAGERAVTGINALIRFASTTGEKFELPLDRKTAIPPGGEVEQHYTMMGWDRLVATPRAWVTATICVYSMDFADGGSVIIN